MKNNFVDPETGEEFLIPHHRTYPKGGGVFKYTDKAGNVLTNPANKNVLVALPEEPIDFSEVNIFLGSNAGQRKELLQKRSQNHFKKEISEQKYEMNKKLVNDFKAKD